MSAECTCAMTEASMWACALHGDRPAACAASVCEGDDLRHCEHCCPLGCNGGACESCLCCQAGWCLNGRDGLPDGETQWGEKHIDLWRELRAEHGITTPEPQS